VCVCVCVCFEIECVFFLVYLAIPKGNRGVKISFISISYGSFVSIKKAKD